MAILLVCMVSIIIDWRSNKEEKQIGSIGTRHAILFDVAPILVYVGVNSVQPEGTNKVNKHAIPSSFTNIMHQHQTLLGKYRELGIAPGTVVRENLKHLKLEV